MVLVRFALTVLFGVAGLQFLYNLVAAFRNKNRVLAEFPGAQGFIRWWMLMNGSAIVLLFFATWLVPSHLSLALVVGMLPIAILVGALVRNRFRTRRRI